MSTRSSSRGGSSDSRYVACSALMIASRASFTFSLLLFGWLRFGIDDLLLELRERRSDVTLFVAADLLFIERGSHIADEGVPVLVLDLHLGVHVPERLPRVFAVAPAFLAEDLDEPLLEFLELRPLYI